MIAPVQPCPTLLRLFLWSTPPEFEFVQTDASARRPRYHLVYRELEARLSNWENEGGACRSDPK
jgi:hypothetical protein